MVQSIFLRLLQREKPPELVKNPRGYLYRAAVNQSLTIVQTRQRRAQVEAGEELAVSVPARASSAAEELHRKLYAAIAQLKPKAASMIFTALEDQLGLRLERAQVGREFLVIDHADRPSSN